MLILGLNAFHGDSSACLIRDGELLAAVEEERFRRIKHWAGFPVESIRYCLNTVNAELSDVDVVTGNKQTRANFARKVLFILTHQPGLKLLRERWAALKNITSIPELLNKHFTSTKSTNYKFIPVEHHLAHLASSFLVSPYKEAALLSVDGFGDFVSTMFALGRDREISPLKKVYYPHSLGLFYTAITQYLGFKKYGDEYKVMGLAALGKPTYLPQMRNIVQDHANGFRLNLDYFVHHKQSLSIDWGGVEPAFADIYSAKLEKEFGPARLYEEPLTEKHADLAASLQARYEEVFFRLANELYTLTRTPNICLAGGCALNSVANGKIFHQTPFREIYIQPAAHDSGGAIGAAYYTYNNLMGNKRNYIMRNSYWGPEFTPEAIETALAPFREQLGPDGIHRLDDQEDLARATARLIADGKIVGWFQGRMEWGPRALGNRSIVVDPRRPEMKDILNERIKRREWFRPFAPSILEEATGEFFEINYPDPFMLKVYPIRPEKREIIPAVTHIDGTGRLQTVSKEENPLYYRLIKEFAKITGVPVVLNTSFNENEPIVCTPEEALNCFFRTKMDVLVLGPYILKRD